MRGGKVPSETETIVMEIFLSGGGYLEVRLTNLFLIEVCQPFLDFIDFFESRKVRCHLRHPKIAILLADHMNRFVEENTALLAPKELVKVDLGDQNLLPRTKVVVGVGVKRLLKDSGLTVDSPEVRPFMESVYRFYKKSTSSLIKYFTTPLNSRILR